MTEDRLSNRDIMSVTDLNRTARRLLEGEIGMVFVEGEISNFTRPSSGHWYLTLKDSNAQLRCAMFVNRNRLVRFTPKNGAQVIVRGRVSLYEGRGEFQLIVEHMEEAGDGALRRAYEKLKATLEAEGLFDPAAKQQVPSMPQHIGVITSPTGAAIRDVLHVLERRFPAIPVTVIPVQVQGEESAGQIEKAIELANAYEANPFDVILLTRGGGSLEDLWSFNTEPVARAIFASRIPLVCAVGHETDITIADFVADLRAPTPSAAAELLSPNRTEWLATFERLEKSILNQVTNRIRQHQSHLGHVMRRLRHPGARLQDLHQRLDDLEMRARRAFGQYLSGFRLDESLNRLVRGMRHRLERFDARLRVANSRLRSPEAQLQSANLQLANVTARLHRVMSSQLGQTQGRLAALEAGFRAYSPLAVLDRGYAIVTVGDKVLRHAGDVQAGDEITARLKDGSVIADVKRTQKEDHD